MNCKDMLKISRLKLKIISAGCDCHCYKTGMEIEVGAMLPKHICPLLLYALIPYYETFHAGGSFPWMKDPDAVIVQCPSPDGGVVVEIKRRRIKGKIEIYGVIDAVKGNCFYGCKEGARIELESFCSRGLCLNAFRLLYPHLQGLALIRDKRPSMKIQCNYENGSIFEIV